MREYPKMRKILVPFDLSENSLRALRHAVDLARALGQCELHIVHVHESPLSYTRSSAYMPRSEIEGELDKHSAEILQPALECVTAAGIPHRSAILTGTPADAIVHYADENDCAGIVMGTRGAGAIGNLLLGSVATKVVHLAHVPVTLVK